MRDLLRIALVASSVSALAACAAIEGLDSISVNACAPNCDAGADRATGAVDASNSSQPDGAESYDSGLPSDDASATGDANGADGSVDAASDAGDVTAEDASADAAEDAPVDGCFDAPVEAAPVVDAGSGKGPVDAAPDSPCGTVYFSDSFDSASGWTLDSTWSVAPTCASPPAPQKGNPDPTVDHTTGKSGGVVAAYACGNNPAGATSAFRYATSPVVDTSSAPSLVLRFYRWLNTDASSWMTSTVDVYDGTTWHNVYTNSTTVVSDSAWTLEQYDVSQYANAAFQVRFGYAVTSSSVYAMSCWNVDDLVLSTVACQ